MSTIPVFTAMAAALSGCHEPQCEGSSVGELSTHGSRGARALGNGHPLDALGEVGVGLGVLSHTEAPTRTAGAIAPVTQLPPRVPETAPVPGAMPIALPTPPPQPPPTIAPAGAPPPVTPEPRVVQGEPAMVTPEPTHGRRHR